MAVPSPLLIVTGPPGAGKSTVADVLAARFERSALVEGDAFFGFLRRGAIAPWLPESNEQNEIVIRAAGATAGHLASGGITTVYDGVVGPWFLPVFAAATGLDRLDHVILLPSIERCAARVATRTGHGFSDDAATRKMHNGFATAEVDTRHVLVDPPEGPGSVADRILAARVAEALSYATPR